MDAAGDRNFAESGRFEGLDADLIPTPLQMPTYNAERASGLSKPLPHRQKLSRFMKKLLAYLATSRNTRRIKIAETRSCNGGNMYVRRTISWRILASSVATVGLLGAPLALAATDPSNAPGADDASAAKPTKTSATTVEEIVVTASKREEKLHDVANSITAITGQDLLVRQELSIADIATQVPGFAVEHQGDENRLIIRGQNTGGAGATVGVVVDDVPFNFSSAVEPRVA